MRAGVSRGLLGHPLATAQAVHARLTKTVAVAVCSSDALSSVVIAKDALIGFRGLRLQRGPRIVTHFEGH
jgi:hypothetical protein